MPTNYVPDDIREQAKPIIAIFTKTPKLVMQVDKKEYLAADLAALEQAVKAADDLVEAKRAELTPLLNKRNEVAAKLNAVLVQARKAVAGYYGEDSDEYELVGGTRKSERKTRRPAAAKTKPAAS